MQSIINKTMDLDDLASKEALDVIEELNVLITTLKHCKLKVSSWYGMLDLSGNVLFSRMARANRGYGYTPLKNAADDANFPWFLYWEIAWLFINNDYRSGQTMLDLGGSSSLFSYYAASKGLCVTTIDIQNDLVDNAKQVAKEMGWELENYVMDMTELNLGMQFDHITSVCVYEHVPISERVQINEKIKTLLINEGTFSITFDYRNPSRHARISSPTDLFEQFVKPSGLILRGNQSFYDNGKNYLLHPLYSRRMGRSLREWLSDRRLLIRAGQGRWRDIFTTKNANDYTFGALFLQKPSH